MERIFTEFGEASAVRLILQSRADKGNKFTINKIKRRRKSFLRLFLFVIISGYCGKRPGVSGAPAFSKVFSNSGKSTSTNFRKRARISLNSYAARLYCSTCVCVGLTEDRRTVSATRLTREVIEGGGVSVFSRPPRSSLMMLLISSSNCFA